MSLGHTVGELQGKMSNREFDLWCRYRDKYGPLSPVRKYDQSGAVIASQINNANGGKATPKDFLMYGKETEKSAKIEDFIAAFKGGVRIGKRR